MPTKKERLEAMARQIAPIIIEDLEKNGAMKPSYLSPKFWKYVEKEIETIQEKKSK